MNPAVGPYAIAACLLVFGGGSKALSPDDTANALRVMGLPVAHRLVRVGGAFEAALGAVALVVAGTAPAVLVAASYAAFAVFVAAARASHRPISSCGCLGKTDMPPSGLHLGVNVAACIAAIGMMIDPVISPLDVVADHFPESAVYVVLVATGVLAAYVTLTLLPRMLSSTAAR